MKARHPAEADGREPRCSHGLTAEGAALSLHSCAYWIADWTTEDA